jgi:hypothetical protein
MQTYDEYFQTKKELDEHWSQMTEEEKKEAPCSDNSGPCKGKTFDKIGSEGHLAAMQYHSSKFNEFKKGKDNAEHVQKTGMDYHTKMYNLHKNILNKSVD